MNIFLLGYIFKTHKPAYYCKILKGIVALTKGCWIWREASLIKQFWDRNWKKIKNETLILNLCYAKDKYELYQNGVDSKKVM